MKLSTLIASLQRDLDTRGDVDVAILLAAATHDETNGDSTPFFIWAYLVYAFGVGIVLCDTPDKDVTRDCTIHKEIRDTRYCDGVVYEKGNK
jgi:hypothetical protein|nr:MAG TPA: hypothetical protein [Caudoviricetes sp.]